MPGTILSDDAEQMYADRLKQHAQSVWDTIASAPQQVAQAVQPAFQAASAASQTIQPIVPSIPQGPDPSAVQAAQQSLLQHAQDAWSQVQQVPQAVASAVNPQASTTPVDQSAANDASARLLQHANDAWQAIQGSQPDQSVQQWQPEPLPTGQAGVPGVDPRLSGPAQPPTRVTSATGESTIVTPPEPDRTMSYQDYAKAAAQRAGIDPNVFIAQIQQESGFNPGARSPAGAIGIAQFMPDTAKGVGVDPTDPYAALDAAAREDAKRLSQYGGDWGKTLASYNAGAGAVEQYGGIPPYKETQSYVSTIMGNAQKAADAAGTTISGAVQAGQQAVGGAIDTAKQAASNVLPAVSQFGDKQLSSAEAYAACGPAAAVRFAQMYGRNPTLREATDLAKGVGWTQDTGMAGLQSESKLFDQMDIPHRVVGADWNALQREAQSGNPVTISTPGHYFTADSYDPKTGAFHVGSSGTDLKSGSEWMTPQQMESVMGPLQGGLAADNPNVPGPSPISNPHPLPGRGGGLVTPPAPPGWQPIGTGTGLQEIDNAVQGAVSGPGGAIEQAAGAVGAAASDVGTRARGVAEQAAAAVEPTARNAADLVSQAPLPFGAGKVSDATGLAQGAADLVGKVQTPDETNPLAARVAGTGLSALGTVARAVNDQLDQLNAASTASREAAGEDVYGQKYATAGGPQLEKEYTDLLAKRMAGDDSVSPRMTEIAGQLQQINDAIRAGRPQSEVNQALSAENPLTPVSTTLTNLGAAVLAAPLAAGEAPLVARALAEIIQPGTNPLALARAIRVVEDAKVPATDLVQAIDRVRKMPGTAELAPVRQQVTQSSTDLLQSMLDAAKAKGVAPEKLDALEQQISAMDPTAATRRALAPTRPTPAANAEVARPVTTEAEAAARVVPAVEATTPDVPRVTPPTNPYELPRVPPQPTATPLSGDEVLSHLEYIDSLHSQNDARIAELQNRLATGPSGRGDFSGTVIRPPWAAGWTNQGLDELARRNGLNPYESNWWEHGNFVPGTGEMRENVGQSGIAGGPQYRGTKLTQQTPTEMRAELTQLQAEQTHLEAAQESIWGHVDQGGDVYGQPTAEALPFDGGGLDTGATQARPGTAGQAATAARGGGEASSGVSAAPTGSESNALKAFLTGEAGSVPLTPAALRGGATVGGAVAGGVAGNATTPEDASTPERAMRILAGAGIGAGVGSAAAGLATSRGILPQQVLENLRAAGVQVDRGPSIPPPSSSERLDWLTNQGRFAPPEPPTPRGPIARAVDVTKQALLSNPATHTAYVIGNVLELLRSPAALAMGGRGDDAIAGLTSVARGIPAAADAARAALQGQSLPTLAHVGTPTGGPVYRVLGAVHAFSRTLGEYQGMAQEASRLLREADIAPNDPQAAAYLAAHANNIYDAGLRTGAGAVFMRPNSEAQGGNFLENMFRRYNSAKEGFLASPDLKQQALGGLMDFAIPFSGIPTQLLKVAANRLPVASQASGSIRAIKALQAGDMAGAQRAIGETGLESTIQLMIAKQIADGNITGADDPDHPDSIRLNGNWVDMKDAGGWTLPMRIMASWADGYTKGGRDIPAGTPGASPLEQTYNYYGPRFSAALTASMKPFAQAVPGENMMRLLADAGSGQGDIGRTAIGLGQNVASRFTPGIARFAENLTDPVARDIDKKGVDSLWKGPGSNIPGLAEMLPAKIDPTTGQPVPKASSGLGIFLGAKNDVASPLTIEARRLSDAGFSVTAPKTYPTEVTVAGSKVSLSPDEQRQVAEQTGATMDRLATQRLQAPEYQNATDARKAVILKAMITAADNTRTAAVAKVLGQQEFRARISAGKNIAGQLVSQAQAPTSDEFFSGFDPSGANILDQRRQRLAGAAA